LWLETSHSDKISYASTAKLLAATRAPLSIQALVLTHAGHRLSLWSAELPAAISWLGKNIPGFGPLGPELVTLDEIADPYNLWMTCTVNGQQRMRVNTQDQIWKLPDIVEHFSRYIPIEPGDMFSTGAPGGVAVGKPNAAELFLKPGDVVDCAIEGFATLRTTIVAPARK